MKNFIQLGTEQIPLPNDVKISDGTTGNPCEPVAKKSEIRIGDCFTAADRSMRGIVIAISCVKNYPFKILWQNGDQRDWSEHGIRNDLIFRYNLFDNLKKRNRREKDKGKVGEG